MHKLIGGAAILALTGLAGAAEWPVGRWVGVIRLDRAKMLAGAKSPEERKLLEYTLGRLERTNISFTLASNGRLLYSFDDGFEGDRRDAAGKWKLDGDQIQVDLNMGLQIHHAFKLKLDPTRRKFTMLYRRNPAVVEYFHYAG